MTLYYPNTGGPLNGNRKPDEEVHSGSAQGTNPIPSHFTWIPFNMPTGWISTPVSFDTPTEPLKNTGIVVGEVIGWRIWSVRRFGGLHLRSFSMESIWDFDVPMNGEPSDYGCSGVWAFKEMKNAMGKYNQCNRIIKNAFIMGSVKMWGKIVEHELGYRAEFARIASLNIYDNEDELRQLREIYKVGEKK